MTQRRMKQLLRQGMTFLGMLFLALAVACSGSRSSSFTLSIVHLNDTHSHLEPLAVNRTINGVKTTAQLGGFARIKTALDGMRRVHPDLLLLHGGDAVQGTLYFALFNGTVDYDFLNMLGSLTGVQARLQDGSIGAAFPGFRPILISPANRPLPRW
jgi:5'-nucleotidase/UDP-sugar diphosphatase